ncbi:terpenoid synthase [Aspergillus novofumigatus IBT 16806]|uniref:Terpene synthase n=1 Tax=Aspergillus novofumigatus (strain IBT 16806) TaxID=1392255 RepID=A0A2I1CBX2_ASPN1|nr:terpenoid synthase [Aspergillus novofumigatus IBT 16806]PKX95128.1 terpenoid synthase [Aspergillus novofumigatus IBT 16806]
MTRIMPALQSHVDFRQSIRGQTARLPNFYALFPEWKPRLHPEYDRARDKVLNPWIERWVPDADTARKFQKADFGRFAAIMCADASFEKMCSVAKAFAWYFIWDDLFDCGSLTHEKMAIPEYRDKSMQYFCAVLSSKEDAPDLSGCSDELQKALLCWNEVAAHIREVCSKETCGVYPVIATIPFIYGVDVSKQELAGELMGLLWRHTSYLVHMINDMFSLRKEIADNQIENLVPILMLNHNIDCSSAVERSSLLVQEAACAFHEVEKRLRGLSQQSPNPVTEMFVKGCKDVVMGLTHWSYTGQRYFKQSEIGVDNVIEFHL